MKWLKGRTHTSDIKINDITVSRHHGMLKVLNDGIYLNDNDSKFGTLVEIKEPLKLIPNKPCYVQIEGTVMALLVKAPKAEGRITSETNLKKEIESAKEPSSHYYIE